MEAIVGATLIDGTGREPVEGVVVLIDKDRIRAVGSEVPIPRECRRIEAKGLFLLPGLTDAHVHLAMVEGEPYYQLGNVVALHRPLTYVGISGYMNALKSMEMGFTTLRDVGDIGALGVSIREAVASGLAVGPRVVACGQYLSETGGHGDKLPPWLVRTDDESNIADGVDGVVKAVRRQIRQKNDWIKIVATGAFSTTFRQTFSDDEMNAMVAEAHRKDKLVTAHCAHREGTLAAVRAGVDSVEHGDDLTEEIVKLMVNKGTYLVPTLLVKHLYATKARESGLPSFYAENAAALFRNSRESFRMALEAGVKIVMGTDSGMSLYPFGQNAREMEMMAECGMSPMEVIVSATSRAAAMLRQDREQGTLEPGKLADLIAVRRNPLADLKILQEKENIVLVMKGGEVLVDRLGWHGCPRKILIRQDT